MWDYTEKVKEYFENPRNVGEVARVDGVGEVGSLACGDALRLTIQVDREANRIEDARFQTFGCASAIASSSALTEMIKGLTIEEALRVTNRDIADYLGGLPKEKMHCSVLGREALEAAIGNYRGEAPKKEGGQIVCECFGVTDQDIERVVLENDLTTLEEVTDYTKAGGGCGSCHEKIEALLYRVMMKKREETKEKARPKKLTNIQKIKLVEETIEREIRPALRADGGDIELVDLEGDQVMVALRGTCSTCAASQFTLKDYVEQKLKEFVAEGLRVVEVKS
jgi:NifU-like protein